MIVDLVGIEVVVVVLYLQYQQVVVVIEMYVDLVGVGMMCDVGQCFLCYVEQYGVDYVWECSVVFMLVFVFEDDLCLWVVFVLFIVQVFQCCCQFEIIEDGWL